MGIFDTVHPEMRPDMTQPALIVGPASFCGTARVVLDAMQEAPADEQQDDALRHRSPANLRSNL